MSVRNTLLTLFAAGLSLLIPGAAWAHATGADPGFAGVPGESNCTACHGAGASSVNTGGGSVQISLPGGATSYTPGQSIRLTVTVSDATARRWGFELASRSSTSASTQAGTLTPADTNSRRNDFGASQYVTHTLAGTRAGTSTSASWDVDWMPPATGGVVTLYAAGNAANNNNNNDSGDKIYTTSLTLTPADSSLPANFRVLPQFVFGGGSTGWYSAIYFYNGGDVTANFPVHFFDSTGQPMSVPVSPGVSSANHTLSIPARGMAVIEAPNTPGSTTSEGWAALELPANVSASGVFRLSVAGSPDQEAVVPLSSNTSKDVILVFDNRDNQKTGVALANPTAESIQVNIVARDETGATIGLTSKTLAPRAKPASFFAEDEAALSGMKGKRGTMEFTVGSGAVTVLGLRVRGLAFTSIPAIER